MIEEICYFVWEFEFLFILVSLFMIEKSRISGWFEFNIGIMRLDFEQDINYDVKIVIYVL